MGISIVVMFSVNKGMLVLRTPYGFQNTWFGYVVDGGACTWSYVAHGLLYLWQLFYINVHKKKGIFKIHEFMVAILEFDSVLLF